ncbi:MAG: tetratricopeptide repeat protein [Bacteroidales bacterium]|nr:tetratricopeptide repeat protein [Bacteroidales bacterium]
MDTQITIKEKSINSVKHHLHIYLSALLLLFSVSGFAFSAQDSLLKAQEKYEQEAYNEAIQTYESLIKEGYVSEDLYYNIANAFFKNNQLAQAILYYERCLKQNPNHEDALFNLNIANLQQADKLTVIPDFFIYTWINNLISFFTSDSWAYLSIAFIILVFVGLYFYLFSTSIKIKKTAFVLGIVFFIFFAATAMFSYQLKTIQTSKNTAIIFRPSLVVKSTPKDNGTDLFVIHEGLKVKIEDEYTLWVKIILSNGNEGWVKKTDIAII